MERIPDSTVDFDGTGRQANDQNRAAEVLICQGPLPPPLCPSEEKALLGADPYLAETVAKQRDRCHGNQPGGRCEALAPCSECQVCRRYLALVSHRLRHGRALHPSEITGYYSHLDQLIERLRPAIEDIVVEAIDAALRMEAAA